LPGGRHLAGHELHVKIRASGATYIVPLIRAAGTVDFRRAQRDVAAAKAFFRKAIKSQQRLPRQSRLDCYAQSLGVLELKADCSAAPARSCARRNTEHPDASQDHRGVKHRIAVI